MPSLHGIIKHQYVTSNCNILISRTWKAFLENTSDPYILLRMPMTKAAVRAMDAITDFCEEMGRAQIKKFMIAGASKRGWTTWTTVSFFQKILKRIL